MSRNSDIPGALCTRDPARWLDHEQQSTARRLCLSCPRLGLRCNRTVNDSPPRGVIKLHVLTPMPRLAHLDVSVLVPADAPRARIA